MTDGSADLPAAPACDDAVLVHRARAGERQAFAELVHRYLRLVVAAASASVGHQEAEDLAQEVFIEAWRSLEALRTPERFGGWLLGIARRMSVYRLRRRKREAEVLEHVGGHVNPGNAAPPPVSELEKGEALAALDGYLQALPEPYREIILLRYMAGLGVEEMAEVLAISRAACDKRLTRAKQRLKELMRKGLEEA